MPASAPADDHGRIAKDFLDALGSADMDALKKVAAPKAVVLRSGKEASIPTAELVPGDVVLLEMGSSVPAEHASAARAVEVLRRRRGRAGRRDQGRRLR